jgi:WD40 repeat protein
MRSRLLTVAALLALAGIGLFTGEMRGQEKGGKDVHGDPLPDGAVARAGTIRWRTGTTVAFAAFLPDGKSVLSVGDDRIVRVWEFPSGKELRRFDKTPTVAVKGVAVATRIIRSAGIAVALSADGKTLACNFATDNAIFLWDVASGKVLPSIKVSNNARGGVVLGGTMALDFSPDGKLLAVLNSEGNIQVWDWANDKEVQQLGKKSDVRFGGFNQRGVLAFAPDGKHLVSFALTIDNNMVVSAFKVWDTATWQEAVSIPVANNGGFVSAAGFSPDSATLAFVDTDGTVKLVETTTGKMIKTMEGPKLPIGRAGTTLLFAADGKTLFQRNALMTSVREWNLATGTDARMLGADPKERRPGGNAAAASMTMAPDGKTLVLTGQDQMIHFIDVASGKELESPAGKGHLGSVDFVRFSPDGNQLWTSQSLGSTLHRWEAGTAKELGETAGLTVGFRPALSADGRFIATLAPDRGAIHILDSVSGKTVHNIPSKADNDLREMVLSPDGKYLALRSRLNQNIELVDTQAGKRLHLFAIITGDPPRGAVLQAPVVIAPAGMLFAPDGKTFASYSEPDKLALWEVPTGKKLKVVALPQNLVGLFPAAWSPDSRCLAFDTRDGNVVLCELATGSVRHVFGKVKQMVKDNLVGVAPPNLRSGLAVPDGGKVAFSPDGSLLMLGSVDRAVHVWDVTSGKEVANFPGHIGGITSVAFAPDGRRVASGSTDTTALVWDLPQTAAKPPLVALNAEEVDARWQALLDGDASKAFAAICALAASPKEAVAVFKDRLQPAPPLDAEKVQKLLVQLDSDKYKERQQASTELIKLGERVVPALDKLMASQPALDLQRRIEVLLERLAGPKLMGESLRAVRAIEALERIATPEARELLAQLAAGAPGAMITVASQAALERLPK